MRNLKAALRRVLIEDECGIALVIVGLIVVAKPAAQLEERL